MTDSPDPDKEPEEAARAKTIKTEAGKRIVPVHAQLIELGLLAYADAFRLAGHSRLFPDLVGGRDGPGQPASKQFGRYCDRIKLTDAELVFHSFRHGAVGRMRSEKWRRSCVWSSVTARRRIHTMIMAKFKMTTACMTNSGAIATLDFHGVINYRALMAHAPNLETLQHSLAARAKRM